MGLGLGQFRAYVILNSVFRIRFNYKRIVLYKYSTVY